jgi:hypothetical protein
MSSAQPIDDDFLNQGVEEKIAAHKQAPPRTLFPTVPSGNGVPAKPAPPPEKPKSLVGLGIGRGGIVRNASTTSRTSLNNPVANPKIGPGQASVKSSLLDSAELTPEFGVPTLVTEMDQNLEQRAKDKVGAVLPAQPPTEEHPPAPRLISMKSTLAELIDAARDNSGELNISNSRFKLQLVLLIPF